MTKIRINITTDKKDLKKIDDHIYKKKQKVKINRSEFLIESSLMRIEAEKRKRKVGR